MTNSEELSWDDLSHYEQLVIKDSLRLFIDEQQFDILCRGTFGIGDWLASEEFLDEVGEFVWEYYCEKLMDEF